MYYLTFCCLRNGFALNIWTCFALSNQNSIIFNRLCISIGLAPLSTLSCAVRHRCQRLLTRVSRPSLRKHQQQCEGETKGGSARYLTNPGVSYLSTQQGKALSQIVGQRWSRPTGENLERWRSHARRMHSGALWEQSKQISRISCRVETITAQRRSLVNWPPSETAWNTWIWMERCCLRMSGRDLLTPVKRDQFWQVSCRHACMHPFCVCLVDQVSHRER